MLHLDLQSVEKAYKAKRCVMLCINVCPPQLSFTLGLPAVDPHSLAPGLLPSDKVMSYPHRGAQGGIPLPLGVGGSVMVVPVERYASVVVAWPCPHLENVHRWGWV